MSENAYELGMGRLGGGLWQRRWFQLALIWAVWTLIALFFSGQLYFMSLIADMQEEMSSPFFAQFSYCYLWALATPLVIWLALRFPLERGRWRRSLPLHIVSGLLIVVLLSAAYHLSIYFWYSQQGAKPYSLWYTVRSVIFNSSQGFGIYALILLFVHAYCYYRSYQAAMLLKVQLEGQLSQAQLQALKMQLQPHFLFNTLHSISALLSKDKEAARQMIARLGDFLRLTLENSGAQEVTLQQEIEFLTCYLEIQRVRFQDRLTTSLDVEADTLDTQVPNLILQPIVENAIRHGIAQRSTPGLIEIQAKHQNGVLRIRVRDNGPGLPVNRSPDKLFQKGLGLANTQTRLERLYGDEHRFEVANDPSGGLVVTLEIPATHAPASAPSLT